MSLINAAHLIQLNQTIFNDFKAFFKMPTDNSLPGAYKMTCLGFTSLRHCTRALLQVHRCPLKAGKGRHPARNDAEMRGYPADRRRKKALYFRTGLLYLIDAWQFPTLAWGDPTLPSALR
ncbi:hypothetical protein, partial [Pantoea ananatis]|uniref:hypothetical protein n=1 Tax=Pantoea ananas TaxID=553 RepID=UPI0021F70E44